MEGWPVGILLPRGGADDAHVGTWSNQRPGAAAGALLPYLVLISLLALAHAIAPSSSSCAPHDSREFGRRDPSHYLMGKAAGAGAAALRKVRGGWSKSSVATKNLVATKKEGQLPQDTTKWWKPGEESTPCPNKNERVVLLEHVVR